jgi:hypothetical protein
MAEKELLRSLTEIDAPALEPAPEAAGALAAGELAAGVELLVLLLQAAPRRAAAAATAVSPALADTEYNGVPRSFTPTCPAGHVRDQIRITRHNRPGY